MGLKYSSINGLFLFLRKKLHISSKGIRAILGKQPEMILQNRMEIIRNKVKLLEDVGVDIKLQKGLMLRVPAFYLKS